MKQRQQLEGDYGTLTLTILFGLIGFPYRNRTCCTVEKRVVEAALRSVMDYGDVIYMHGSAPSLKPLDAVYHSAVV